MQTRVPRWAIERLKSAPVAYRSAVRVRRALGVALGARAIDGVPGRVHRNDTMIDGTDPTSVTSYVDGGRHTIEQFRALASERVGPPADLRWMELGCGYGRLVRQLVQHVPAVQVEVTDIDERGASFCAAEFGVQRLPVGRSPIDVGRPAVDVLYAVSVLSHLDMDAVEAVLDLVVRSTGPGGLAMLSTHGPSTLEHLHVYGPGWPERRPEIEAELTANGAAFLPYPGLGKAYGMAWHEPAVLTAKIHEVGGSEIDHVEVVSRGLEEHQDLYLVQRSR